MKVTYLGSSKNFWKMPDLAGSRQMLVYFKLRKIRLYFSLASKFS